jgi:hypothetical protein
MFPPFESITGLKGMQTISKSEVNSCARKG